MSSNSSLVLEGGAILENIETGSRNPELQDCQNNKDLTTINWIWLYNDVESSDQLLLRNVANDPLGEAGCFSERFSVSNPDGIFEEFHCHLHVIKKNTKYRGADIKTQNRNRNWPLFGIFKLFLLKCCRMQWKSSRIPIGILMEYQLGSRRLGLLFSW